MAATQEAMHGHGVYEAEYRVCRPDGTTGWVQSRAQATSTGTANPSA